MTKRRISGQGRITKSPATPETVDERARQLALIAGREPNRRTGSDLRQARGELLGDDTADAAVHEPNIEAKRLDKRPFSTGREIPKQLPTDDDITERTVQEGVDEAEHDEMVEASKHPTRSEG